MNIARVGGLLLLLGVAVLVNVRVRGDRARAAAARAEEEARARAVQDSAFADSLLRASEDMNASVTVRRSDLPAPERDRARIATLLATESAGTYIDEMLAVRDGIVSRWPERLRDPLLVWIQDAALPDYRTSHPIIIREAFQRWANTGIPMAFAFTLDSADAEIHITWVDRYESRTSGRTRSVRDQHGWILGASIELALRQPNGDLLSEEALSAIAKHEVGHLLGLDHCASEQNIMSAQVRVRDLSAADEATMRLWYRLPPGRTR